VTAQWEVTVELPMRLPSMANLRLHWATKARTVKAQRSATGLALRTTGRAFLTAWQHMDANPRLRLHCLLTRVGPRALDDDNLQGAFKAVRDEVAATFGIDDGSERWRWQYAQERGLYAVRIRLAVFRVGQEAA
jgi:hypothetical protein